VLGLSIEPTAVSKHLRCKFSICRNTVLSVIAGVKLAKPVLFAPAMNTMMYEHMLTGQHIRILTESFGYTLIPTVTKRLLCGEVGDGALANIETILEATFSALLGTNAHCLDVPHC
jgi:phosphopantothenoylcysteine decarboxylase